MRVCAIAILGVALSPLTSAVAGAMWPGEEPEWSSDGTLIAYSRVGEDGLYLATPDGEQLGAVVEQGRVPAAWWNGDTEIIYTRGDDLWISGLDGSNQRIKSADSGHPIAAWDGTKLGFWFEEFGGRTCFLAIDYAEPATYEVLCNSTVRYLVWHPSGDRLIGLEQGRPLTVLIADGSVEYLDQLPDGLEGIRLSPDGARFVYAREDESFSPRSQLYVWEDGQETRITNRVDVSYEYPRWSPDGTRVACTTWGDGWGGFHVEVIPLPGTPTRRTSWSELRQQFLGAE